MKKKILIGIHGKAGAGKNTVATEIRKRYEGQFDLQELALADSLKGICATLYRLPVDIFYDAALKNIVLEDHNKSPRQMMQEMSDLLKSGFGEGIFVEIIKHTMKETEADGFLITDVRYEFEATAIREMGGFILHVINTRPPAHEEYMNHSSEAGIKVNPLDYYLYNDHNAGIAAMSYNLRQVVAPIFLGYS